MLAVTVKVNFTVRQAVAKVITAGDGNKGLADAEQGSAGSAGDEIGVGCEPAQYAVVDCHSRIISTPL